MGDDEEEPRIPTSDTIASADGESPLAHAVGVEEILHERRTADIEGGEGEASRVFSGPQV